MPIERYSDEQIAALVHRAIQGLQEIHLDPTAEAVWALTNPELRVVSLRGARRARYTPGLTPAQHHEGWLVDMSQFGWRYGPVRDTRQRTHPNMVEFDRLQPPEQFKDELGLLLVAWGAGKEWPS